MSNLPPSRQCCAVKNQTQRRQLTRRRLSRAVMAASMLAGAYATVGTALGQTFTGTFTWINAAGGNWYTPSNWNDGLGATPPSINDDTRVNTGGVVTLDDPNGAATAGQLIVADDVGQTGTLSISAGSLSTGVDLRIGGNAAAPGSPAGSPGSLGGSGTMLQSGGVVTVGANFNVGVGGHIATQSAATGYYRISGGTLNVGTATGNFITVGNGAGVTGQIDQTAGWVESKGSVILGRNGGIGTTTSSTGTYNISGGTNSTLKIGQDFLVGGMTAGVSGVGVVNQGVDTTVNVTHSVFIGTGGSATITTGTYSTAAIGTYTMNGGTLAVGTTGQPDALAVGAGTGGFGRFIQNGGTVSVNNLLQLGRQNSTGIYDFNAGTILLNGMAFIGGGNGQTNGTGTFNQAAGTLFDLKDNMNIGGTVAAAVGTIDTSGQITFTKAGGGQVMAVGNVGTGTVFMRPGSSITSSAGTIEMGRGTGGNGTMSIGTTGVASNNATLTANTLVLASTSGGATLLVNNGAVVNAGTIVIGSIGTASPNKQLLINGGQVTAGSFNLGSGANTAPRLIQLSSGTLGVTNMKLNAVSTLTVNGGRLDVTGLGTFDLGSTVNLNAGAGSINSFNLASNGVLNVNGGSFAIGGGTVGTGGTLHAAQSLSIPGQVAFGTATINVDPAATLTLAGTNLFPAARLLTKTGGGTLVMSGAISSASTTFANGITVAAGTARIDSDAGQTVTVSANGGSASFGTTQHLPALNVGSQGFAEMRSGANKVLVVGSLNIDGGAAPTRKLDLHDNKLIVDYAPTDASPLATIQAQIKSAYGPGNWSGNGITSTEAPAGFNGHTTALGYAEATSVGLNGGTFGGQTVDNDAVLVRYTFTGDNDLNGKVDLTDFTFLAGHFNQQGGATWQNGDYNYDGNVDLTDFTFLAGNFNATIPAADAAAADGPSMGITVPEPASFALYALASGLVLARQRRQTKA